MALLYLDCFSGISGDMTVGALVDAGADFEQLRAWLKSLPLPGFDVRVEKVKKKGVTATQFHVDEDEKEHHPHRGFSAVVKIIEGSAIPAEVKAQAIETFRVLGEAEAQVHGRSLEEIHFHEVGAVDSIVDIVAAQCAMHLLNITEVAASPVHVGAGSVKCAHGVMPVPAPATALLLKGIPTYGGEVQGELTTPTGAALLAHRAGAFGGIPPMETTAIGYGSGTRDLGDRANVLRVMVGERTLDSGSGADVAEIIQVMEAHMDDMNPELYPPLMDALLNHGARDVFMTPVLGKKGRPAQLLTILCDADAADTLAWIVFHNSTTLGLRVREETRYVLDRAWVMVNTPWGLVRVKLASYKGVQTQAAPEFEDCRACAAEAEVPVKQVYEAALAAALRGEFHDE